MKQLNWHRYYYLVLGALLIGLSTTAKAQSSSDLAKIKLPPGFHISIFARVPNARSMVSVPEHDAVFIGNRRGGSVYVAVDKNRDGRAEDVAQITSGLVMPNGVAWKNGFLYIAEQHRIFRVQVPDLKSFGRHKAEVIFEDLPNKSWHGWRYIAFDEAQRLHVTVGSPCNICTTRGNEGTIIRLDKSNRAKIIAKGIRNSVGMDFHPRTGQLYFTDNGADFMGDDSPPDELNHLRQESQHFGFPYFGGGADLLNEIYHPHGIHSVLCGMIAPEAAGWYRRTFKTPEDLKNLRMRISGLGAKVMTKLGVQTRSLEDVDIFLAFENGDIDAAEFSMPAIDLKLGFHELASHYYFPGWHQPSSFFELMINKDKWDALPKTRKSQIQSVCGDNVRFGLAEGEALQYEALKELTKKGVKIHRWPDAILNEIQQAWIKVAAEQSAADAKFSRVWQSLSAFRKDYAIWQELSRP